MTQTCRAVFAAPSAAYSIRGHRPGSPHPHRLVSVRAMPYFDDGDPECRGRDAAGAVAVGRDKRSAGSAVRRSMQCRPTVGPVSTKSRRIVAGRFRSMAIGSNPRGATAIVEMDGGWAASAGMKSRRIDLAVSRVAIDTDRIEPHPDQSGQRPRRPAEAYGPAPETPHHAASSGLRGRSLRPIRSFGVTRPSVRS